MKVLQGLVGTSWVDILDIKGDLSPEDMKEFFSSLDKADFLWTTTQWIQHKNFGALRIKPDA